MDRAEGLWDERICRVCGCTDSYACPGGCYWVDWDLCSACAEYPPMGGGPPFDMMDDDCGIERFYLYGEKE